MQFVVQLRVDLAERHESADVLGVEAVRRVQSPQTVGLPALLEKDAAEPVLCDEVRAVPPERLLIRGDGVVELPEIPDGTRYHYLVSIEGPEPVDTLYRLTVECE